MVLVIQIALGILLGYLLIEHRGQIGAWSATAIKVALTLIVSAIVFFSVYYVASKVGSSVSSAPQWMGEQWKSIKRLVGLAPLFVILGYSGYGFILITRKMCRRWFYIEANPLVFIFLTALNVLLIWPIDFFLRERTVYGEFFRAADLWSRQNGYADSIAAVLSFSLTLWPWLIIFVASRFGARFREAESSEPVKIGD